jgi:transposase-like protein
MPRRTPRRRGRKTLLTPQLQAKLLSLVEDGNHISTACAHVGIGVSTLYRWLDQAATHDDQIKHGERPDVAKQVYVEFRDALALARARAEERAVDVIQKSMKGGFVISETPIQDAEGNVQRDDHGRILYSRTYTQPDGRLALAYLARSSPDRWGQNPAKLELSGPAGGPIEVGAQPGHITALAERLHEVYAKREADRLRDAAAAEESGDVHDAEFVDDEEPPSV